MYRAQNFNFLLPRRTPDQGSVRKGVRAAKAGVDAKHFQAALAAKGEV